MNHTHTVRVAYSEIDAMGTYYNSRPLDHLLDTCPGPEILPASLQTYFRDDVAAVGR